MISRTAVGFALLFCAPLARAQNVVKYHTTMDDVKYTYNSTSAPVARLTPGGILETNTVDAFGNAIQKPGDTMAMVKGDNPLSGPFYIETAEPGDTLAIHFLGCIGVAPAGGEARSSTVPAEFGGNMDAPEASVGNTLYLPVNVPGALLYMGDGHAAMGDGEVAGTAIEVALLARVQVNVIKGKKISWPRFENNDSIMALGAYRPVDDALRIAFTELVGWMHKDYGLSTLDAYELLSKVAKIHLDEMVDPNYVVVASIDKKFLPPKKK